MSNGLTKKDLWNTLGEFFEQLIAPYFEKIIDRLDCHLKMWEDHEQRIRRLELSAPV